MDALIGLASGGALAGIKKVMGLGGEALKDAIEAVGKHVRKCTNCFVAGTLVATACGLVPIEEVQSGDWVLARDEVTGEVRLCEVEETYRNESPVILEVSAGGETLATTPGHPFWVLDHGWKDAGDLEVGDCLVNLRGESVVVEDIRRRPVPEAVYNFSVAGLHTYFVGEGGIWVHNNSATGCGVPGAAANTTAETSRRRAMDRAQNHAQVPRTSRGGEEISFDDLNTQGSNSARIRGEGATNRGRRDSNSSARFEDHPDGHPTTPGPDHHNWPHVHGVNKNGDEIIVTYPKGS
jgi:hypothetical protein